MDAFSALTDFVVIPSIYCSSTEPESEPSLLTYTKYEKIYSHYIALDLRTARVHFGGGEAFKTCLDESFSQDKNQMSCRYCCVGGC